VPVFFCHECGYYTDRTRYCKWCGARMKQKSDHGACARCEYNSLNHAKQPNGNGLLDCFKHMLSFPNLNMMVCWAKRHCNEPDANDDKD